MIDPRRNDHDRQRAKSRERRCHVKWSAIGAEGTEVSESRDWRMAGWTTSEATTRHSTDGPIKPLWAIWQEACADPKFVVPGCEH